MSDELKLEANKRSCEAQFADLIQKYPYMFASEVDLSHFGPAIGEGWKPIFRKLCAAIDSELTTEEKALFQWRYVKQEFGGLRAHWQLLDRLRRLWLDIQNPGGGVPTLSPQAEHDLVRRIKRLVYAAMDEAQVTCETCGAIPARFDDTGGDRRTLCDRHIAQRRHGEEDGDA